MGSAAANNYFGTADMNGNVWEWNDAVSGSSRGLRGGCAGAARGLRGGSWPDFEEELLASYSFNNGPALENDSIGFRVASVPEPTSILLTMLAGGAMLIRRKR